MRVCDIIVFDSYHLAERRNIMYIVHLIVLPFLFCIKPPYKKARKRLEEAAKI